MKIGIVGAGAMGCVYAALMADAGNEVWAIDTWQAHVDAIVANGLRLEGASGDRTVALGATSDPTTVGPCDLVIVATKAPQVEVVAAGARALLGPETPVLTIQNGLGSAAKVARILGQERVIVGVVGGFGASIKAPGHAHHNGMELVRLGEAHGAVTPRLERIAALWRESGFTVKCFDDIDQLIWEKLICNVCYSGTATLTGLTVGEIMADADAWPIASGCAAEAYRVARAKGIRLDFDDPVAYVHDFGAKIPGARPSMLLDHMAGRRSEIDAINGAIPPEALALGLEAPYNTLVSALVRAKETGFDTPQQS